MKRFNWNNTVIHHFLPSTSESYEDIFQDYIAKEITPTLDEVQKRTGLEKVPATKVSAKVNDHCLLKLLINQQMHIVSRTQGGGLVHFQILGSKTV